MPFPIIPHVPCWGGCSWSKGLEGMGVLAEARIPWPSPAPAGPKHGGLWCEFWGQWKFPVERCWDGGLALIPWIWLALVVGAPLALSAEGAALSLLPGFPSAAAFLLLIIKQQFASKNTQGDEGV